MTARQMKFPEPNARALAGKLLVRLWRDKIPLDQPRDDAIPAEIRARAGRLARETLRGYDGFDRFISEHATKQPQLAVKAILHCALYELWVEKTADYAVVDSWVNIAKSDAKSRGAAGFVNSLLRRAADEGAPAPRANQHFGKALAGRLRQIYGHKALEAMNAVLAHYPPTDFRIKSSADLDHYSAALRGAVMPAHNLIRVGAPGQISALPGYADGDWWIQDLGATIAVDQFNRFDGETLDLAAAPGGKTMQLADRGARVTAVEINPARAERIKANLERTGLTAELVIGDGLEFNRPGFQQILLDAPCSSTGTFRRHPDLRFVDVLGRLKTLVPLQTALLAHAFELLDVGGELVYVTCSLLPEEGEEQIARVLATRPEARLIPLDNGFYSANSAPPYIRTLPHHFGDIGGIDGFFIAKLTKIPL